MSEPQGMNPALSEVMQGENTEFPVIGDVHNGVIDPLRGTTMQTSSALLSHESRAEEELRQAKETLESRTEELARYVSLLTATLESTADGIMALDLAGNIVAFNTKFVSIWQFPEMLLERRNLHDLLLYASQQAKDPEEFLRIVKLRQSDPENEAFDVIEFKDGRTFERYGFPQMVNDQCVGSVVNFREITGRKRTEQALAVFAAIVDSAHDAIVSKTLEGIITSWNYGAERIFGYTSEEVVGKPILLIIPPELADEEPRILARQRRGEGVDHFETVRIRKDGQYINVSITLSPIKDAHGTIVGVSKIARDITERKQTEVEREDLLARERNARRDAEAANRSKDEFLATLSHELRTPLTAILGWSHIIGNSRLSEEDKRQGLEIIQRNANLQSQLVEDILDVSRIITGKLRLDIRPIELVTVIEAAVESVLPAAQAKSIRLQRVLDSGTSLVSGDASRLQQVVWNLLSNAIKFTPKQGRVQIRLERVHSHVEIVVADTGAGIDPEVLPHVFERFRQADQSSTRTYGGLGLGLAIVRHIVETHGGSVEAHSPGLGHGATFTVKLPLMATRAVEFEPPTTQELDRLAAGSHSGNRNVHASDPFESPTELQGLHVLIVDDEEDSRRLVQTVLETCQARVTIATSAAEAFAALQSLRPDVLISDLGMPGEDGYSLIGKVRALPPEQGGQTPAAALTAYARVEDRLKVLRAGFQIHLPKPIEPAELVVVVANLAKRVGR